MDWLDVQDNSIQSWVRTNSNNAKQFIRALDLYKMDSGITKHMPNRQTAATKNVDTSAAQNVSVKGASVNVGDSNKRAWTRKEIDRMSASEFALHEAEIDLAHAEGRIR
jgi:hypothetical protein